MLQFHSVIAFFMGFFGFSSSFEIAEFSPENNILTSHGQSYGYDIQCYVDHFIQSSKNGSHSEVGESEDAVVTFKRMKYDPSGYDVVSTNEVKIEKGKIYDLIWVNNNIIAADFQRNLTFGFDGKDVTFAIGKWVESSTLGDQKAGWDGCQFATNFGTLEYYDYKTIRTNGKLDWLTYKYDVTVNSDGPRAPSYDNSCVPRHEFGTKEHVVNVRHLGEILNSDYPWEYSNQNYTIPSGKDIVIPFEAKKCTNNYDFQGCKVEPRNLTLWVDEDNQVKMAMARLDQANIVTNYGHETTEEWVCAEIYDNDDGSMDLTFASFVATSPSVFVGQYDTIYVRDIGDASKPWYFISLIMLDIFVRNIL